MRGEYKECETCTCEEYYCYNCVEGRFMDAVNEYASTCDLCHELTGHDDLTMDEETQLGYCSNCVDKAFELGLITKVM